MGVERGMDSMKVHITLTRETRRNEEAKQAVLGEVMSRVGLKEINARRFERYGIISGEVDPERILELDDVVEIQSVEPDEEKYAL